MLCIMNKKQGHEKRTHPQIHYTFPLSLLPCLTVELFIAFHSTSPPSVAIMSILSEGLLFVLGCWTQSSHWFIWRRFTLCGSVYMFVCLMCAYVQMVGTLHLDHHSYRLDRIDALHHVLGKH